MQQLRSRMVLNDARVAIDNFIKSESEQELRLNWILSLTLLRATGHVLKEVDFIEFKGLKGVSNWENDKHIAEIVTTIDERCASIKRYELNFGYVIRSILDENGEIVDHVGDYEYVGESYYGGYPADAYLQTIYHFWDGYISKFEKRLKYFY